MTIVCLPFQRTPERKAEMSLTFFWRMVSIAATVLDVGNGCRLSAAKTLAMTDCVQSKISGQGRCKPRVWIPWARGKKIKYLVFFYSAGHLLHVNLWRRVDIYIHAHLLFFSLYLHFFLFLIFFFPSLSAYICLRIKTINLLKKGNFLRLSQIFQNLSLWPIQFIHLILPM